MVRTPDPPELFRTTATQKNNPNWLKVGTFCANRRVQTRNQSPLPLTELTLHLRWTPDHHAGRRNSQSTDSRSPHQRTLRPPPSPSVAGQRNRLETGGEGGRDRRGGRRAEHGLRGREGCPETGDKRRRPEREAAKASGRERSAGGCRGAPGRGRGPHGRGGAGAPGGSRGHPCVSLTLTAVQRGLAEPALQVAGLAAGLPQGQVVLVVRRHPSGAQHGSQVQAQRQEDAHQSHQLQRGQHRDAHLFHTAAGRSHGAGGKKGGGAGGRAAAGPEGNRSHSPGSRQEKREERWLTAGRGFGRQ